VPVSAVQRNNWMRRIFRAGVVAGLAVAGHAGVLAQELIPPEDAFRMEAGMADRDTLSVTWHIEKDHYMYRHAFSVRAPQGGVALGEPSFPGGERKRDDFFGEVETYRDKVTFTVPVAPIADGLREVTIEAVGQGCNEPVGVCFPPATRTASVGLPAAGQTPADPASGALDSLKALFGGGSEEQEAYLHPDEAFRFEVTAMDSDTLLARFFIEPGYYLYKDKFEIESADPQVGVAGVQLPAGTSRTDEYFGDIEAYYDGFDARIDLDRASPEAATVGFNLAYQGCADGGICYPPIRKQVNVNLPGASGTLASLPAGGATGDAAAGGSAWPIVLALGSGLLLTFTPCVLPMIPILAGIIIGQGGAMSRARGGVLAGVYVLGTAVTYTVVGIVAGLTGEQLQAWFQNAWAVGILAALVALMALSMFGFYELRLPSAVQTRLQSRASGLKAGALGGVFLMGLVSALIVGACVSPVLISVLGLAINRGDPVLGGAIMFAMALGMGAFLIAMGFGFGHILPRSGPWMEQVKRLFGVLLLAVAVYLLGAIPEVPVLYLWAALFLGTAVYLGVAGGGSALGWRVLRQLAAVVLIAWAVLAALGGLQGNRDVLRPVDAAALVDGGSRSTVHAGFQRVAGPGELARVMGAAAERGRPVMVDYYADWCVDCVRMENTTFTDPAVATRLNRAFVLVQIDVTDPDDPGTRAIKQAHGVYGPPAMLFFDASGSEVRSMRRYGYMGSEAFLDHIEPLAEERE